MTVTRLLWAVLLGTLLNGCTGLQKKPLSLDWDARRDALLAVSAWSMQGQVAIKADSGGGQASISWQQTDSLSRLRLAGPFGAGQVELTIAPALMTLTDASGEQTVAYTGADAAERFMAERLGWSFPVHSARYWVLGLLDPAVKGERRFDTSGTLRSLTQHGWTVNFDRYAEFDEHYLPAKLVIESADLRLRMVVRGWTRDAV